MRSVIPSCLDFAAAFNKSTAERISDLYDSRMGWSVSRAQTPTGSVSPTNVIGRVRSLLSPTAWLYTKRSRQVPAFWTVFDTAYRSQLRTAIASPSRPAMPPKACAPDLVQPVCSQVVPPRIFSDVA